MDSMTNSVKTTDSAAPLEVLSSSHSSPSCSFGRMDEERMDSCRRGGGGGGGSHVHASSVTSLQLISVSFNTQSLLVFSPCCEAPWSSTSLSPEF